MNDFLLQVDGGKDKQKGDVEMIDENRDENLKTSFEADTITDRVTSSKVRSKLLKKNANAIS